MRVSSSEFGERKQKTHSERGIRSFSFLARDPASSELEHASESPSFSLFLPLSLSPCQMDQWNYIARFSFVAAKKFLTNFVPILRLNLAEIIYLLS